MTKKDGGPAFPVAPGLGMTLRDWFAGQALAASYKLVVKEYSSICDDDEQFWEWAAKDAYGIADAMIAEREK